MTVWWKKDLYLYKNDDILKFILGSKANKCLNYE